MIAVQISETGVFERFKHYLELVKLHLCLYIGLSAVFGHIMAGGRMTIQSLVLGGFVLLLSCGSAVLNNIQDQDYDRWFDRTCHRSLPDKKVPIYHATIMAVVMMGGGLSGLLIGFGFSVFAWGVMATVAYNALYTPLKKRTLLAIVPGCISGMLPPMIGWTAAGASSVSRIIFMILVVFCLWQIPHFFLILLKNESYSHHQKGETLFPCFTSLWSHRDLKFQVLIWTSLYSLAMMLFLVQGSIFHEGVSWFACLNAMTMTGIILLLFLKQSKKYLTFCFAAINLSILCFMGAGILDQIFL